MESSSPATPVAEPVATPPLGFAEFFQREAQGQVRRAALLLDSVEDGNDVVHEAMVRLYQRRDRVDEPGPT